MTTYGTIPTSSSPSGTPANLEYISRAKERIREGLGDRRPWREMFDVHCLSFPRSFREAVARVKTNFGYFTMNYAIVFLVIMFFSLIWHPISLIVFAAMMAVWLFLYFLRDEPLVVFGRLISDKVVLIVLSILTIGVLLLTGAIANILGALVGGVVVVLIHAVVRKTESLGGDEEAAASLSRTSS
ncbi:hypothetical protein ACP275_09G126600 [Erythranthe tilingii]